MQAGSAVLSPVLGREGFAAACRQMPLTVYAPGGMRVDLLHTAVAHNAQGTAMLDGIR